MKHEIVRKFRFIRVPCFFKGILQDVRFSFRMLRKNIGFSAIAILMLAVGVAGNFVMFSVYNAFFLRPLPFPEGERLVDLNETAPLLNLEYTELRYSDFYRWREANRSFEAMAAFDYEKFNFSFEGASERVKGIMVTHDFLSILGIEPVLGRSITADDDRPGGDKVVLLGNRFWKRMFGGKEDVVGKTLKLDGELFTIIGVLPDRDLLDRREFCIPLQLDPDRTDGPFTLKGIGRLKKGVGIKTAQEDLRRIQSGLVEKNLAPVEFTPVVTGFADRYFGDQRLPMQVALAAVCVVLLIACGNMTALMLARGLARSHEFILRRSLGATPLRIARLIGMESLMLAVLGGLAGLLIGCWGLRMFLNALNYGYDLPQWINFGVDWRVCLFIGLMVVISALLGALPLMGSSLKPELNNALMPSTRQTTTSASGRRHLRFLVVAELVLTLILMIHAGWLIQKDHSIQKIDPGFRSDHLLVYEIDLEGIAYESKEAKTAFFKEHLEAARNLPGVISAGAIDLSPLSGDHSGTFFEIENAQPQKTGEPQPVVLYRSVLPGYFETMGIPILAGRSFSEQDGLNKGTFAVIVDKSFAERTWPQENPIGKRIRQGIPDGNTIPDDFPEMPWLTVVGVAGDVKHYGLDQTGHPGVYLTFAQESRNHMSVILRTSVEPASIVPSVRELVAKRDVDLPVFGITTMADRLLKSTTTYRIGFCFLSIFAGISLIMAIGGIYGVFSYVVTRRTQEIGVRMALGARRQDVMRMVLKENLVLASVGIGIGLLGALVTAPLTASLLVGVNPFDPVIFVGISLLLAAVSMIACWLPARRATKIQPMAALRYE